MGKAVDSFDLLYQEEEEPVVAKKKKKKKPTSKPVSVEVDEQELEKEFNQIKQEEEFNMKTVESLIVETKETNTKKKGGKKKGGRQNGGRDNLCTDQPTNPQFQTDAMYSQAIQ